MIDQLNAVADKTQALCDVLRDASQRLPEEDRNRIADAVLELCAALEGLAPETQRVSQ